MIRLRCFRACAVFGVVYQRPQGGRETPPESGRFERRAHFGRGGGIGHASPMTSDTMNWRTEAPPRAAASLPPPQRVKRFRTRFMALMSSPEPSRRLYRSRRS